MLACVAENTDCYPDMYKVSGCIIHLPVLVPGGSQKSIVFSSHTPSSKRAARILGRLFLAVFAEPGLDFMLSHVFHFLPLEWL